MTSQLFIGRPQIHLRQIDSTNNYARTLLRDKMPTEGTVILADEQTAGRGQRSNSWLTEPGKNLTCSYLLKPVFLAAKDQFILSAAVALAVSDAVASYLQENLVQVKWPNDIFVDGKKIAGILIENTLRGSNLETSIVGIGLNVNQMNFPENINATSLQIETERLFIIEAVLEDLNRYLEKYYLQLRANKHTEILDELNQRLLGLGQNLDLDINGIDHRVKVLGIKPSGELELEHPDGQHTSHQHHEIQWNLNK